MVAVTGKFRVGTKVWLNKGTLEEPNMIRVEVADNRVKLGDVYHGYKVKAYSESFSKHYYIGAVNENSLSYRKEVR